MQESIKKDADKLLLDVFGFSIAEKARAFYGDGKLFVRLRIYQPKLADHSGFFERQLEAARQIAGKHGAGMNQLLDIENQGEYCFCWKVLPDEIPARINDFREAVREFDAARASREDKRDRL